MGVYIKGMEMPKSCPCELVGSGYDLCCSFVYGIPARVKEYYECCQNDTRASWCPLVPVPPHGDLIDRGALIKGEGHYIISFGKEGIDVAEINRAPTIIPAEEGE